MQTIQSADGTEINYERHGDGRPLVLLHGGMAPREYWRPLLPHLEDVAAIVPQRPGFGTCRDGVDETGPDDVIDREVEYVRTLVDALDDDPILFGHSFGALTAIETARTDRQASDCDGSASADGAADVDAVVAYEPAILPESFAARADLADRMQARLEEGEREEALKLYIRQVIHAGDIDDLDAWLAEWPVWPACVDLVEEVVRMNRAVERYDLPDRLAVDAPTLVLTGTEGPHFLRESARDVHAGLPNSRLVDFDGVGHSGPAEAPERTAAELRAFLQGR